MPIYVSEFKSMLGIITLLSDGDALTGLALPGQKDDDFNSANFIKKDDLHIFVLTREYLTTYFKGEKPLVMPHLSLTGTAFQQIVWEELVKIPYGETITYGELATRVALIRGTKDMSSRAIGHAVG